MTTIPLLVNSLLLLPLVASSSLLSMELLVPKKANNDSEKHIALDESIMVTPIPTKRGLGFVRSSLDILWDHEEENLYKDLKNKSFDVNNSSYHRKLDTAIEIFVSKDNNKRITEILDICRNEYPKQIKLGDSPSRMAHEFLVRENIKKQTSLKNTIETKDKLFIEKQNILLAGLKKSLHKHLTRINASLDEHLQKREIIVEDEAKDIRRLKIGLVQLHHLNKTFILPTNRDEGYCSDEEKNPDNVINSYSDEHLLKKINVDFSMNSTKVKTEHMIKTLNELNQTIQDIPQLRYQ